MGNTIKNISKEQIEILLDNLEILYKGITSIDNLSSYESHKQYVLAYALIKATFRMWLNQK